MSPALHPPERPSHTVHGWFVSRQKYSGLNPAAVLIVAQEVGCDVFSFTFIDWSLQYTSRGCQSGDVFTKRYEGQRVAWHDDSLILEPTGIQVATKSLPGPTIRQRIGNFYRRLDEVFLYGLELLFCLEC